MSTQYAAIWTIAIATTFAANPHSALRNRGESTLRDRTESAFRNRGESALRNGSESAIRNPQSATSRDWRSLLNGQSLAAWRGYKSDAVPDGWKIDHGTLAKNDHVGDLITRDQFGDFEFELEWKIGRA